MTAGGCGDREGCNLRFIGWSFVQKSLWIGVIIFLFFPRPLSLLLSPLFNVSRFSGPGGAGEIYGGVSCGVHRLLPSLSFPFLSFWSLCSIGCMPEALEMLARGVGVVYPSFSPSLYPFSLEAVHSQFHSLPTSHFAYARFNIAFKPCLYACLPTHSHVTLRLFPSSSFHLLNPHQSFPSQPMTHQSCWIHQTVRNLFM
ncbi:hypothetical protein HDK90DRAFT_152269 [Phyllosticta capitalensis]|uniref:Uncharacterized protein n=1 Tax=Phyllosticta capitalensis TaxID=121624 RepID=A0ABR1Z017_9PEZI